MALSLKTPSSVWACPLCAQGLVRKGQVLGCANGHSYDLAKQGYVNLLLSQHKRSAQPGDNAAMVAARRAFLGAGHYDFLMVALAELLGQYLSEGAKVLDLGCGEGAYLHALRRSPPLATMQFYGVDISKAAVKWAAKRNPQVPMAVASNYHVPVSAASMSAVYAVFAPVAVCELRRILVDGGVFVRVSPGSHHLYQLKQSLYARPEKHGPAAVLEGAVLQHRQCVQQQMSLSQESLGHLLAMTPLAWCGCANARQQLLALDHLQVDADFVIELIRFDPRCGEAESE